MKPSSKPSSRPSSSTLICLIAIAVGVAFDKGVWQIPREWNPFAPLVVSDPVTPVTRWKLKALSGDREACLAALKTATDIDYTPLGDYTAAAGCPLENVVRLSSTQVAFSSSFVASCPLALAWTMYERHELQPLARQIFGEGVSRVQHYGSFACRNIYHRENARRSEHATASALDVAAFRLEDGRRISVLEDWGDGGERGRFLEAAQAGACHYFGTTLGPNYNAAHANHFHLGMRGVSFCR
ncbi:extensin family protein [Salinicola sp. LHM]|uniref:extensin-like domain-containing protein n=1 Tax=Salinicola sp. LHM TaxID=3065298 RepID=UPI002ACD7FE7|nr:extensin family protein [Salinicola sp. LHM]WQH32187.1 extensin family protein [Salinicola sp. LHM]